MWTGSISFGLVSVPVKMYPATEDHDVRFHQVHLKDQGRISYQRKCGECGDIVQYSDIGKAYETSTGERVVFTEEDFDSLPVAGAKEIDVIEFVPTEQIDPVLFDRCYYLEPEPRGVKPYVLLREALEETERTAIVKIAIRARQQLAALRVRGEVIVLQTMLWPDEVRTAHFDFQDKKVDLRPQELAMAGSLIETLNSDWNPDDYQDEYREAVLALVDEKLAGGEGVTAKKGPVAEEGQVLDLMAALQASVERSRKRREGDDAGSDTAGAADADGAGDAAGVATAEEGKTNSGDDKPESEVPAVKATARKSPSRAPRKAG